MTNQVTIAKKDISVTDSSDNPVRYIRAPGEYKLRFDNVRVNRPLANLAGEISATLQVSCASLFQQLIQVPVFEGPVGLRFDYPYTIIPETRSGRPSCDALSGAVKGQDREYWWVNSMNLIHFCSI